ncbi:hypothetical protein [Micrococcus luteus]|uniref:hypothetical protein n=1 Tax=Micrococcus luteus TaxID=1270 RepID=UPI0023031B05|nr:hypothetical protein [Micrococcus luteus]
MEQQGRTTTWWLYALGAVVATVVALVLLFGPGQGKPLDSAPATAASSARPASSAAPTSPAGEDSSVEPASPELTQSRSVTPSPSVSTTSAARAAQASIEQQAVAQAVEAVSEQDRQEAEETARTFIADAYALSWDLSREQWVERLGDSASPEVVDQLNMDQDWDSSYWSAFVDAKASTQVRLLSAQAQNVTEEGMEVAVAFTTQTDSSDQWVAAQLTEHSETVVVDPSESPARVVSRLSMETAGGL